MTEVGKSAVACFEQDINYPLFRPLTWTTVAWLRDQGVSTATLARMATLVVADGLPCTHGTVMQHSEKRAFIAFYEEQPDDVVFWCAATGEIATWFGRVFALGEDNIRSADTYLFDRALHVFANPLDWLKDDCRGIVVVRWDIAFDMLRDVPRIAVAESLLPLYRRNMAPCHQPELSVIVRHSIGVSHD